MSGLIAIVGRPNVGKSALFNRIARRRIAIVHDLPGVTRDRVMAEVEWHGHPFTLVDTGGIGLLRREKAADVIQAAALEQVDLALEAADVILMVVNVQEGLMPLDEEVASKLRHTRKPVLVVVNKVDTDRATPGVGEFSRLGFDRYFPVTAIHGYGIEALMDAAIKYLPEPAEVPPTATGEGGDAASGTATAAGGEGGVDPQAPAPRNRMQDPNYALQLAIVGRPNVGKSSIINALIGSQRVIVSPIPGTTRDAVDVPFEVDTEGVRQKYTLIDTAGVRKARRVDDSVEFFSVKRTEEAIGRCDIAVLVIDAVVGISEQDKKLADVIVEQKRACIVVVNKWDLMSESVRKAREEEIKARVEKTRHRHDRETRLTTLSEFGEWVQEKLFFLDYAPVIFTSATEGFQLDRLLEAVRYVGAQLRQQVPTGILNRTLNDAVERRQPVSDQGHRLRFYYATQVKAAPPTFLLFVNRDELFNPQYTKYLAGMMRTAFGYEGCPIIIVPKARPKTIEPLRKYKRQPFATDRNLRHGRESHRKATRRPAGATAAPKAKTSGGKPAPLAELPPRLRKGKNRSNVKPGRTTKRRA